MAIGRVCVLPGILPATMRVAPNSPVALAKAMTVPAAIPRHARGSVIVLMIYHSVLPRSRAASSISFPTPSIAAFAGFTNKGRDETREASTAPFHVKTICIPRTSSTVLPKTSFFASSHARTRPAEAVNIVAVMDTFTVKYKGKRFILLRYYKTVFFHDLTPKRPHHITFKGHCSLRIF